MDEHLHVNIPLFLEDVEPIHTYFGERLPDLDDGFLVVRVACLCLEVRLPLLDLGGVHFVALLVLHVIVRIGVDQCHDHVMVFRQLHFKTACEVRGQSVLLG